MGKGALAQRRATCQPCEPNPPRLQAKYVCFSSSKACADPPSSNVVPIANEPTEDLVAFQTTYGNSLDKSKQILGLMGEKNRDALA